MPGSTRGVGRTTAPHGRPRAHDGSSSPEQAILDATERLLGSESLQDLRVHRILDEAGVSRASFYFYFKSKEVVLAALLARVIEEHLDAVHTWLTGGADPREGLRRSLHAGAAVWARHRAVLRAVVEHWAAYPELDELWRSAMQRLIVALAKGIDAQRAVGVAPPGRDSAELAAALVWGGERTYYVASLGSDPALGDEMHAADILYDVWVAAIYGGPPA